MPALFRFLRALSFANSTVFTGLLVCWLLPGLKGATTVLGWTHGWMWIALSVLSIVAVRRREMPFWLAVVVAVVGGVGPYAGSAGFVIETRRRASADGHDQASASGTAPV
jgi:hypothetical protein